MNRISKSVVLAGICALVICAALTWVFFGSPNQLMLLNILLLILATMTAVAAIGGETWHKEEPRFFKRLTPRGWVSLICLVLTLGAGIGKEILTQQESVKQQQENERLRGNITGLEGQVKAANDAQKENTKLFLGSFKKLSDELGNLRTQAKTEELQKKLATMEAELQKTQKALAPGPKAVLAFSFLPFINPSFGSPAHMAPAMDVTLPVLADGSVHVEFTILNISDVDAVDGELTLEICTGCKFAKEPAGFRKLAGQSDRERVWVFQRILARTVLEIMTMDIIPPRSAWFLIGMAYRCRTCVLAEGSKAVVRLVR
jgi:hypothetical protein